MFFVWSGCSRSPDPWLNGTVGQWCWAALQGIPYTHKECDPAWTMASTLTRDPSNSFTWTLQAHLSSAAHMSINHCLLNLLKSCWVLQFVSSFVLAAQLSIVSPPLFHNLPHRYPAQDRDGALESSHWFTSCRKSWRDQAGKRRDRGPITYTAHLREWTWWQPPPPRSQLCSSSGRPALSGCWGSVASHWRWTSPGTCRKRCLLSWSTAPAGGDIQRLVS